MENLLSHHLPVIEKAISDFVQQNVSIVPTYAKGEMEIYFQNGVQSTLHITRNCLIYTNLRIEIQRRKGVIEVLVFQQEEEQEKRTFSGIFVLFESIWKEQFPDID